MKTLAQTLNAARYVLITPARNEAKFIEGTIQSVVAQTIPPARWIIVSDGSTDGTDEIVTRYARQHGWIELLRMPERETRHFAGKARAFNAAYAMLANEDFDFIGSLDADLTFQPDYFAFLLARFAENARLGLAGTPFQDVALKYDYRFVSIEHVSGACQMFRRRCFEQIGGYVPVPSGGVDHIAVVTARLKGWETRTFTERVCVHHREMGSARHNCFSRCFACGHTDYALGGHPLWELCRGCYQMTKRPFIVGGMLTVAGYMAAWWRGEERPVTAEFVSFRRQEQMTRLRHFFQRLVPGRHAHDAPEHTANPAKMTAK